MTLFWAVIGYLLYLYIVFVLARIVVEMTRMFARKWRPVGVAAIGIEVVYVSTDPPVRLLRRLIPPLRIGPVSLDLSIYVLLIVLSILNYVANSLAT